jgi:drug/metabolite transporter (DMT)-like permease
VTPGPATGRTDLALAAAALTGIQVGAAMVASRWIIADIGPATLALLRYAIATLVLLPFVLSRPRVRFARVDRVAVTALGIVQFGVLIALLNVGLRHLDAALAALLFASFPLMTGVIASVLGREAMTAAKWMGVGLAFVGVGLVLWSRIGPTGGDNGAAVGAGAVLTAAFCGALCSVLYRPYLERYPTLPVGALAMAAATLFLLPLSWPEWRHGGPTLTIGGWAAVGFVGLSSGIGYCLWLWALKHAPPTVVTNFLSLSPVTAAVLGVGLLGEAVTPVMVGGLLTVAAGLWIATRIGRTAG